MTRQCPNFHLQLGQTPALCKYFFFVYCFIVFSNLFSLKSFLVKAIIAYMFRELMHYCVVTTGITGICSLSYQNSSTANYLYLNFWSGNIYYQVCLGSGPHGILLPKKKIALVPSYLGLFESPPSCLSLINFDERLGASLIASLPGRQRPMAVSGFGPMELEKCLAMPTSRILEKHDFRTILDFLLMKLRATLDQEWLQALRVLHKVWYLFHFVSK